MKKREAKVGGAEEGELERKKCRKCLHIFYSGGESSHLRSVLSKETVFKG